MYLLLFLPTIVVNAVFIFVYFKKIEIVIQEMVLLLIKKIKFSNIYAVVRVRVAHGLYTFVEGNISIRLLLLFKGNSFSFHFL